MIWRRWILNIPSQCHHTIHKKVNQLNTLLNCALERDFLWQNTPLCNPHEYVQSWSYVFQGHSVTRILQILCHHKNFSIVNGPFKFVELWISWKVEKIVHYGLKFANLRNKKFVNEMAKSLSKLNEWLIWSNLQSFHKTMILQCDIVGRKIFTIIKFVDSFGNLNRC